jgi:hypothetical protein
MDFGPIPIAGRFEFKAAAKTWKNGQDHHQTQWESHEKANCVEGFDLSPRADN